jgi:hypothetical protein
LGCVLPRRKDAVSALPAGQRQAAEAYYLTGLTQAETAAHLRIPASAVKTRLHKARAALRASLRDYQPERHTPMTTALVPVTIRGVFKLTVSDLDTSCKYPYVIMLAETDGDRRMYIFLAHTEATALAVSLSSNEQPRPLTYQFTAALLAASGARLREIRISHLTDGIFYAHGTASQAGCLRCRRRGWGPPGRFPADLPEECRRESAPRARATLVGFDFERNNPEN